MCRTWCVVFVGSVMRCGVFCVVWCLCRVVFVWCGVFWVWLLCVCVVVRCVWCVFGGGPSGVFWVVNKKNVWLVACCVVVS